MSSHASCCSPCISTRGFILFVTAALLQLCIAKIFASIIKDCRVTYALMLVIAVVASDVVNIASHCGSLVHCVYCIVTCNQCQNVCHCCDMLSPL